MAPDGCAFAPGRDKASFQPRTWKYYRQHRLRPRPVLESRIDRAPRTRTRLPRYLAVWRPSGLGLQSPLDEGQRNCSTSKRCMTTKRAVTWNGAWWKATGSCCELYTGSLDVASCGFLNLLLGGLASLRPLSISSFALVASAANGYLRE